MALVMSLGGVRARAGIIGRGSVLGVGTAQWVESSSNVSRVMFTMSPLLRTVHPAPDERTSRVRVSRVRVSVRIVPTARAWAWAWAWARVRARARARARAWSGVRWSC